MRFSPLRKLFGLKNRRSRCRQPVRFRPLLEFLESRTLLNGQPFYVSAAATETQDGSVTNPFATIQQGVNAASSGDTILVEPGTYNQAISLNKNNLMVESTGGAGSTTISGLGGPPGLVTISANGDTFQGFTVDISSGHASTAELKAVRVMGSNNLVENNIIIGAGDSANDNYGILVASSSGANNKILDNVVHDTGNAAILIGGSDNADGTLIQGNEVYHAYTGIYVDRATNTTLDNNNVHDTEWWGVRADGFVARPASGTLIENNLIHDNGGQDLPGYSNYGYDIGGGIYVNGASPTIVNNEIYHNVHVAGTNAIPGIYVGNGYDNAASFPVIHDNSIHDNDLALQNGTAASGGVEAVINRPSTGTVDASGNWWGSNNAATIAGLLAGTGIDFTPYLDNGTDTASAPGFQGDFSTLDVTTLGTQTGTTGRVQEAINLATSGGTVNVAPGIYYESLTIDRPLTVTGTAGAGATFLNGNSAGENYYMVTINAANVDFSGFDISNKLYSGTADASGIVIGSVSRNSNIRVHDNVIHNIGTLTRPSASFGTFGINCGPVNGAEFDHNTIYNIGNGDPNNYAMGIFTWGNDSIDTAASINILDNNIHDISSPGIYAVGIALGGDSTDVTVDGNTIASVKRGITTSAYMDGAATIQNNIVTGATDIGILARSPYGNTVYRNDVNNSGVGLEVSDGGVLISASQNFFTNNGTGILIASSAGMVGPISINSISGNTVAGLDNESTQMVDASNNWWGSDLGPNASGRDSVKGNVQVVPWLVDGIDAEPATPGFQHAPGFGQPGSAGISNGVLYVFGTVNDDHIQVRPVDHTSQVEVKIDSKGFSLDQTFSLTSFSRMVIYGLNGNDHIEVDNKVLTPTIIFGGAGNDHIQAGGGPTLIEGGSGNDHIEGGSGNDVLIGGPGDDHIQGKSGRDLIIGGTTAYDNNLAALWAILDEWQSLGTYSLLTPETVFPDTSDNHLDGGSGADVIFAAMNDKVSGDKKHDLIIPI